MVPLCKDEFNARLRNVKRKVEVLEVFVGQDGVIPCIPAVIEQEDVLGKR